MLTWFKTCNEICDAIWWRSSQISTPGVDGSPLGRLACIVWNKKIKTRVPHGLADFCGHYGRWYYQRDGVFEVEMSHGLLPSYNINLQWIQGTPSMLQLTYNILSECVCAHTHLPATFVLLLSFLSWCPLMDVSRGFSWVSCYGSRYGITHW